MKRILYTLSLIWMGLSAAIAQINERVYVQTDKDFYLSGEKMYLTVYGQDKEMAPLDWSRVVYVELLGDAFNSVQVKVEMKESVGSAVIELPYMLSSGVYDLVAYTRWMRNEGEAVFFRKPIGVYNSLRYTPAMDRIVFEDVLDSSKTDVKGTVKVTTDKPVYGHREKVGLTLENLPSDARLTVSVVRKDVELAETDKVDWHRRVKPNGRQEVNKLIPELEGLIIEARYVSGQNRQEVTQANLSVKGREFHYYPGKSTGNGNFQFFTPSLSGMKELVASVETDGHLEMTSPFVATPPAELQPIRLDKNQEVALLERSMQVQTGRFYPSDSIKRKEVPGIFMQKPQWSYDLDNYRRFRTFEETFLEFIPWLGSTSKGGKKYVTMFDEVTGISNNGNTLVMLDGVTVMDHDAFLKYNPYFVKWVDVYIGKYVLGGHLYDGIVTFRTPNHWMPNFQLPANSVVVEYEGVQPDEKYVSPNLENPAQPDFRHTLYWNPHVTDKEQQLECWTSDMCGTYIIKVEGWTDKGERVESTASFEVQD